MRKKLFTDDGCIATEERSDRMVVDSRADVPGQDTTLSPRDALHLAMELLQWYQKVTR